MTSSSDFRTLMAWLGYAGLAPFYILAALAWASNVGYSEFGMRGFVVYSLAILAFLAGSLWGSANVRDGADKVRRLVTSNVLTVLAALAVMLAEPIIAAVLLGALHLLQLWYEANTSPATWYLTLRRRLTFLSIPAYLMLAGTQVA